MTIDKAIILSAGQGSRLLPLTRDIPKCLIEFNGRSLISWQVAALVANGIKDIVVVTGFRTERVEDHALQLYRDTGARIRTLFNPFFQVADNLGTCWIAREEMDRNFIILNGDTIVSDLPGLTITREQVGGTTRVRAVGKINGGGEKVVLQATGGDIRVSTGRAGPTLVKPR